MHIIVGLAGLWATLVATRSHMPNGFTGFFHPAALILLLGAPPSILLVGHDVREIWRGIVTLAQALRYNARRAEARMIGDLYRFGRELKQSRTVEASKVLAEAEDPLLREVGPLLLQPGGGADARETVLTLSYARLAQVKEAEEVFRFLARTTPAVGLMGTIVGLVNMLINLKNFEQLGPAMAVAQLATFYGLILAYAIWSPFAKRIENYGRNLSVSARLLERGLTSIAEGRSLYDLRLLAGIERRRAGRGGRVIGAETNAAAGKTSTRGSTRSPDANDLLAYGEEDDTSWLIPYVDVVSLLLAFLILALAMSKVNLRRFEMVSAAISHQAPPPSLDALKEKIDTVIAAQGLQAQVKTVVDDDGLRMELKNALLFDSGQADITPTGHTAIDRVGKLLPTIDNRYQIAIEGHTDDVPIHTGRFDSNWELSSARAINVLKAFTGAGVSPQRLSAQGYADTRPATPVQGDASAQTRARTENRRVVIRVH